MLRIHPISGLARVSNRRGLAIPVSSSVDLSDFPSSLSFRLVCGRKSSYARSSVCVCCGAPRGSWAGGGENWGEMDGEFLEAVVLTSETARHYHLRKYGFLEERKWWSSSEITPFTIQAMGPTANVSSIGSGLLRRFRSPTIFLKVSCDGDLLLPIVVGEYAVEKLIEVLPEEQNEECPSQFQFVKNLVSTLGYEVKKVQITNRVVNTYYARIYLCKAGGKNMISVDARPSDAINVAKRCKAPIYVSKEIIFTDALRLAYGKWRGHDAKSVYDVSLDSAPEGPDPLIEELDLLKKMNEAVQEERYRDAAMLRDELSKVRTSRQEF